MEDLFKSLPSGSINTFDRGVRVRVNQQTNKQIIDLQEILSGPLTAFYVHT